MFVKAVLRIRKRISFFKIFFICCCLSCSWHQTTNIIFTKVFYKKSQLIWIRKPSFHWSKTEKKPIKSLFSSSTAQAEKNFDEVIYKYFFTQIIPVIRTNIWKVLCPPWVPLWKPSYVLIHQIFVTFVEN